MTFSDTGVRYLEPLGLFDFVALERQACVLTDSGTVQEECAIFRVPSVTLRDVTERPETIEAGSNMLAGVDRRTCCAPSTSCSRRRPSGSRRPATSIGRDHQGRQDRPGRAAVSR